MAEDDKELFESAFKDDVTPEPEREPEKQVEERPRDEHGRFAPKAQEEAEIAEPEPQQQKSEGIPSWRLKEEAEARRAAEERARATEERSNALAREMEELRRQVMSQTKKAEEAPPPEPWDAGYTDYIEAKALEKVQKQNEVFSMRMAVKEYGQETVETAYAALGRAMQSGDPAAQAEFQRIQRSQDPYEDLVHWHKRQQVLSTVGNDPNAWLEKQLEERLKDPTYQAALLERIRGTAQQQRPVTQLPPSLNKTTRANTSADVEDESDAGLLKSALRR
jgi:hypothetical protein